MAVKKLAKNTADARLFFYINTQHDLTAYILEII